MKHVVCAALALVTLTRSAPSQVKIGDAAPDFQAEFLHSSASSLADLRGRVVLLDFWRTW
jgi:cytochrome c biogenesis protein CcmG/thiol:disulfide interchange protein DsbE